MINNMVKYTFGYFKQTNCDLHNKVNYATDHYTKYITGCDPTEYNRKFTNGVTLWNVAPGKFISNTNDSPTLYVDYEQFYPPTSTGGNMYYTVNLNNKKYYTLYKAMIKNKPIRLVVINNKQKGVHIWGYFYVSGNNFMNSNNMFTTFYLKPM